MGAAIFARLRAIPAKFAQKRAAWLAERLKDHLLGTLPEDLRTASQLPQSAAFKEFVWRFVNVMARALVALGRKPDYEQINRYASNVEPLLIDYFEGRSMPFVLAVNPFDGHRTHELPAVREAVQVDEAVPMLWCDARHRGDVKNGLIALVELALRREKAKQFA